MSVVISSGTSNWVSAPASARHTARLVARSTTSAITQYREWFIDRGDHLALAQLPVPEFVKLGAALRRFHDLIWNTLDTGTTSGRVEATNTHLRALTKRAYGLHSPDALIAMASLTRGGLCPPLPG